MSLKNGDRARFQKERRRKMLLRQRIQAMLKARSEQPSGKPASAKAPART
jgi:hypothetical protein